MEKDKINILNNDDLTIPCAYHITPNLRYKRIITSIDFTTQKEELRLQQMWQGSDGSERWEFIDIVE